MLDCQRRSKNHKDCQTLSNIVKVCLRLSKYVKDCQRMSKIEKDCQRLTMIVKDRQKANLESFLKLLGFVGGVAELLELEGFLLLVAERDLHGILLGRGFGRRRPPRRRRGRLLTPRLLSRGGGGRGVAAAHVDAHHDGKRGHHSGRAG